jgi:probable metal-binding protein
MTTQVHGSAVRQMVNESTENYTRESLLSAIIEKFGENTRFYSCSAENMTADELLSFFEGNGKLSGDDYTFAEGPGHKCSH